MPQGLGFSMDILDSWLYGGNPAANLETGKLFTSLNRKLEEGWFERLLGQIFMDNPHNCQVLLPSATLANEKRDAETERLRAVKKSWGVEDISGLQKRQAALIAWQSAADTPEALAALPALQLSDIAVQPERIPLKNELWRGAACCAMTFLPAGSAMSICILTSVIFLRRCCLTSRFSAVYWGTWTRKSTATYNCKGCAV